MAAAAPPPPSSPGGPPPPPPGTTAPAAPRAPQSGTTAPAAPLAARDYSSRRAPRSGRDYSSHSARVSLLQVRRKAWKGSGLWRCRPAPGPARPGGKRGAGGRAGAGSRFPAVEPGRAGAGPGPSGARGGRRCCLTGSPAGVASAVQRGSPRERLGPDRRQQREGGLGPGSRGVS